MFIKSSCYGTIRIAKKMQFPSQFHRASPGFSNGASINPSPGFVSYRAVGHHHFRRLLPRNPSPWFEDYRPASSFKSFPAACTPEMVSVSTAHTGGGNNTFRQRDARKPGRFQARAQRFQRRRIGRQRSGEQQRPRSLRLPCGSGGSRDARASQSHVASQCG